MVQSPFEFDSFTGGETQQAGWKRERNGPTLLKAISDPRCSSDPSTGSPRESEPCELICESVIERSSCLF